MSIIVKQNSVLGNLAPQSNESPQFGSLIKMTLANNGNLGIGVTQPRYRVTSAGIIQGASITPYGTPTFLVGGASIKVGASIWNGDVHVLIGENVGDGTNAGMIQVTAGDVSFAGTSIGNTPYNLVLQPGGGNVSIGVGTSASISKLNVGGNVRCDYDFVTNTDTPGFTLVPFSAIGSVFTSDTQVGGVGHSAATSYYIYKVIGKTVVLHFYIRGIDFTNNSTEFFFSKLPTNLWPATSHEIVGNQHLRFETGVAWYRNGNYSDSEKACQVQLLKYTSGFPQYPPNTWHLRLTSMTRNNVSNPGMGSPYGSLGAAVGTATIALSKWFADTGTFGQPQTNSSLQGTITYGID